MQFPLSEFFCFQSNYLEKGLVAGSQIFYLTQSVF